jgi:putative membrane protein
VKIIIHWLITAVAIFLTAWLLPGINNTSSNGFITVALVAIILGFMNAVVRPILALLSCGCIIATMGLFMLVINALMLWLTGWVAGQLHIGFSVDGFWPALWGSIIISLISFVLSMLFLNDRDR